MTIEARLDRLTLAKAELDSLRPLSAEVTDELRQRYDVRLTYHSTAIEGNTLTQSETQIVLEKGITIGGKPLRDHLEVIGHRDALEFVYGLASRDEPIAEREIREIHSLVMKGQDQADAGAYRMLDVMAAGTEFRYPSHLHLNELMQEFTAWLSATDLHPVVLAAVAHLKFVTIHPFRDGNGRVGRLLLNLILIRAGYPVAVLHVEDRVAYIESLVAAQETGNQTSLVELVVRSVENSLAETITVARSAKTA